MVEYLFIALVVADLGSSIGGTIRPVPAEYPTIQAAIDAAQDGDVVLVADGTYHETINFNGKTITVKSENGPTLTTIDATGLNDSVVKCVNGETPDATLQGFTITGGTGDRTMFSYAAGGGMLNVDSSPTVTDCIFRNNHLADTSSPAGGGMYNQGGGPFVSNCVFENNRAESFGIGGAMRNFEASTTVINCTFVDNQADFYGGAVANGASTNVNITGCVFINNWGLRLGGGIYNTNASPSMFNCTFVRNRSLEGGGIFNRPDSSPNVSNW